MSEDFLEQSHFIHVNVKVLISGALKEPQEPNDGAV